MRESLSEYFKALGYWGWTIVVGVLVSSTGGFLNIVETTPVSDWVMPSWGWFTLAIAGLVVAPFVAFHRQRVLLDALMMSAPEIKVESTPDDNYVRLRVENFGGRAEFSAIASLPEHENGTPWPVNWRGAYDESVTIHRGGHRVLNIASVETRSVPWHFIDEPKPVRSKYIKFHTARLATGLNHKGEPTYRDSFEDPLKTPTMRVEVSLTAEPPFFPEAIVKRNLVLSWDEAEGTISLEIME